MRARRAGGSRGQLSVLGFQPSAGATCVANDSMIRRLKATPHWLGMAAASNGAGSCALGLVGYGVVHVRAEVAHRHASDGGVRVKEVEPRRDPGEVRKLDVGHHQGLT